MARELAILVTARNMASGALKEVRGDIRGIQSEARRGLQNTARNLSLIGAAGVGVLTTQVKAGLDSLAELERMQAQTEAVIKSTGGAAGLQAEDIRKLAEEYENLTTVDDKAIQNAENLLLTFTNVRKEGFEPALQAILDMNAAMGGDEESLQNVAIQVGKALNDPVRGATALRRVGVSLTEQQQEQIKTLVEQNDLYGAQQIVLQELAKEFGGSAAAQADTFQGKMKRVQDAVEGAQMALATAFLPVLEKVADKLNTWLTDPAVMAGIESLGGEMADAFDTALGIIEKIPWDAVGSTFSLMGQGAKVVLDMFASLPPWVQTAVLTGWGLNKLSGGALGNIVGSLASGLIKGVLGINAGVVNVNAATVNGGLGGGVPGGAAGGGLRNVLLRALGIATAVGGGVTVGAHIGTALNEPTIAPSREFMSERVQAVIASGDANRIRDAIQTVKDALEPDDIAQSVALGLDINGVRTTLEQELAALEKAQQNTRTETSRVRDGIRGVASDVRRGTQETQALKAAAQAADSNMLAAAARTTGAIQALKLSPTVNVTANITNNVSLQAWQRQHVVSIRARSVDNGGGGFI